MSVKRINRAVAKVMVAAALSATVVVGAAGIASAVVESGGVTNGTGKSLPDALSQAAAQCDSGQLRSVEDYWTSGDRYWVTATCA